MIYSRPARTWISGRNVSDVTRGCVLLGGGGTLVVKYNLFRQTTLLHDLIYYAGKPESELLCVLCVII